MPSPNGLWTPDGVVHTAPFNAGYDITGGRVVAHIFHFHDKATGRRSRCTIPADNTMSQGQIEDMAATAFENWLIEVRAKASEGKHAPSPEERKEVGRVIREFREYAQKRRESTNQRLYYKGLN